MWLPPSNKRFIMTQLLYWIISACQPWQQANALLHSPQFRESVAGKRKSWASQRSTPDSSLWHSVRRRLWLTGSSLTFCVCLQQKPKSASLRTTAFDHLLVRVHLAFRVCLCPANYGKQRLRSSKVNINLNNDTAELTQVSSQEMCVWCTNAASASSFSTSVSPDNSAHLPFFFPD